MDLPKFMGSTNKEKANTLLQIIGVGQQLAELDRKKRSTTSAPPSGRLQTKRKKFALEQDLLPGRPHQRNRSAPVI